MFGGLNRLLAASLGVGAVLIVLAAPPTAFAGCNGRPSAENVYSECLPSGGGGKGGTKSTSGGPTGTSSAPHTAIPSQTARALRHAGADRRALFALVKHSGRHRLPPTAGAAGETSSTPTALGSAFDLGSGPTALLMALVGTAVFLLAASGVRGWRRSHRA